MQQTLDTLTRLGGVLLDAWVAVDPSGTIVACNAQFRGLFSKALARRMIGSPLEHYVSLEWPDGTLDIVAHALERGSHVRYDEVVGYVTDGPNLSLIVSATPVTEPGADAPGGVLVILRDVSDHVTLSAKYRQLTGG